MKRSKLNAVGKIGKINKEANRILKILFASLGVEWCEIGLDGCCGTAFLTFAHRHKRIEYRQNPEMLSDYNQVILACVNCHNKIEYDRELSERIFTKLRGDDLLS